MTGITVKELLEATGGNLLLGQEDQHAGHISLDSRKMEGMTCLYPLWVNGWTPTSFSARQLPAGPRQYLPVNITAGRMLKPLSGNSAGETGAGEESPWGRVD
ncbi:MAG: hypothetical protein ACLR0U_01040 [Enterocloster clostridioformis]